MKLFDASTGAEKLTIRADTDKRVNSCALSADCARVASGGRARWRNLDDPTKPLLSDLRPSAAVHQM